MADSKIPKLNFGTKSSIPKPSISVSLEQIPSKGASATNFTRQKTGITTIKAAPPKQNLLRSNTVAAIKAPLTTSALNVKNQPNAKKRPATSNLNGPVVKQTKVKIASYDYKARYNELLDKHTELKSNYEEKENKLETFASEINEVKLSRDKLHKDNIALTLKYNVTNNKYNELEIKYNELQDKEKMIQTYLRIAEDKNIEYKNQNDMLKSTEQTLRKEISLLQLELEKNRLQLSTSQMENAKVVNENNFLKNTIEGLNNQICTLEADHDQTCKNLKNTELKVNVITTENKTLANTIEELNNKIIALQTDYETIYKSLKENEVKNYELTTENTALNNTIKQLNNKIDLLEKSNKDFQQSLQASYDHRKILHNTVMELRGNIRVFCRIRPILCHENEQDQCIWNYPDEYSLDVMKTKPEITVSGSSKIAKHEFVFDRVFTTSSTQDEVFKEVETLVQSAIDGYNVCIFAYGQTGSGKTYTMEGSPSCEGLIPRCIDYIFKQILDLESLGWSFKISASFLEIYNEQIHDLLDLTARELDIRLVNATDKNVYVTNLSEVCVKSPDELMELLRKAQRNRATAQTDSNERSSRSHSVAKLTISSVNSNIGQSFTGVLNLVDLAGSESPKTSVRMDETKNINKSLAQLGKVILSLQQKQVHIPYRSSKLTYLLMPSLGGNSKTLMFVNLNPLCTNFNESINSLRFASQVNQVKTLKASKNKIVPK